VKSRSYIVTLAACASAALGTPVALAAVQAGDGAYSSARSTSSQSTLATMLAAGTSYHAAANYRNERTSVGTVRTHKAQTSVRPDDRSGPRGI